MSAGVSAGTPQNRDERCGGCTRAVGVVEERAAISGAPIERIIGRAAREAVDARRTFRRDRAADRRATSREKRGKLNCARPRLDTIGNETARSTTCTTVVRRIRHNCAVRGI